MARVLCIERMDLPILWRQGTDSEYVKQAQRTTLFPATS